MPERRCVRNVCKNHGWLVNERPLPTDEADHDAGALPVRGCSNLFCTGCMKPVKTRGGAYFADMGRAHCAEIYETLANSPHVVQSELWRVYVCHCEYHAEGGQAPLDDVEGPTVAQQSLWSCHGHPLATLPCTLDGVHVTEEGLPAAVASARDGLWLAQLATRLSGTPHEETVVAGAASALIDPDPATRVRAVAFFAYLPQHTRRMHADVLFGAFPELFVGVPSPFTAGRHEKTLDALVWGLTGDELPSNAALRDLAHTWSLDGHRATEALFYALAVHDSDWFRDNVAAISSANPALRDALLEAADGLGVRAAILWPDPVQAVVAVLRDARVFVARPDNDYTWSSWIDEKDALAELDRRIEQLCSGGAPGREGILFAPTGPMQELAASSGWGNQFLELADRYDDAVARFRKNQ